MSENRVNKIAGRLWEMANELRGNMDAGVYVLPVVVGTPGTVSGGKQCY